MDGKILKTALWNNDTEIKQFPSLSFFKHKFKMTMPVCVFNSSDTVQTENIILMWFLSTSMVFNFLQRNMNRVSVGNGFRKIPDFLWTWFWGMIIWQDLEPSLAIIGGGLFRKQMQRTTCKQNYVKIKHELNHINIIWHKIGRICKKLPTMVSWRVIG